MKNNWVLVGSIGRPHGIKGWLKVNSYTEPKTNILLYQPWYLGNSEEEASSNPSEIKNHRIQGQNLLVQFAHYQTPEDARFLTNRKIYITREKLARLPAHEYYWTDLEGLKVYTEENLYLGMVQAVFATGANDVLVVQGKKRYLIPFLLDHTIKSIDLEQQKLIVDWDPAF